MTTTAALLELWQWQQWNSWQVTIIECLMLPCNLMRMQNTSQILHYFMLIYLLPVKTLLI